MASNESNCDLSVIAYHCGQAVYGQALGFSLWTSEENGWKPIHAAWPAQRPPFPADKPHHQHHQLNAIRRTNASNDMNDPTSNDNQFEAAEKAIRKIGSSPWFGALTPDWQRFLVSHTVETFDQYELTMDQAAQKLIEFYVEITLNHPEAKTINPWEARLTT